MRPKIAESISEREWRIYEEIKEAIALLPPILKVPTVFCGVRLPLDQATSNTIPNCHAIVHALTREFPVEAHDGFILELREKDDGEAERRIHYHSWLTIIGGDPLVIIDAWPLGQVSGPTLAIQEYAFRYREFTVKERKLMPYFSSTEFNLSRLAVSVALKKIRPRDHCAA